MTTRAAIATTLAAAFLALFGVTAAPAGADPADKVTICHATSDVDNPYVKISVSKSSLDGAGKNDHQSHTGSVFDFSDAEANEDWGDIIPSSEGVDQLNWDAGQAIHLNGCNSPQEGSCPDGSQPVEGECSTEETCPSGEPAVGGECSEEDLCELDDTLAADDPACDEPELCAFDEALDADDPACVEPEVTPNVVTPLDPESDSTGTEVLPTVVHQASTSTVATPTVAAAPTLPATGSNGTLAVVGSAFVALGTALLLLQRQRQQLG